MENRKTFTFNGVNSADYGLYISGDSVYNAPSRVYEMVDIAGRNGQLAIDQGRFENIEVTYPAFIFAETQTEFAQRLREIRAWLMSPVGYQRLEDTYHPDEFRMAIYMSGLEADPTHYNEAGEFELTFNCKPQRFLKSGEEEIVLGEWGETETITGDIATFEGTDTTAIKSVVAEIVPKQSGTGDPSPTNVRPISGWSGIVVSHSGEDTTDPQTITKSLGRTVYGGTLDLISGVLTVDKGYAEFDGSTDENWQRWTSGSAGAYAMWIGIPDAYYTNGTEITFNSNYLKPIRGIDTWGNYDSFISSNAVNNIKTGIRNITTVESWREYLANNPLQVVYELSDPQTYQLTPEQIETLLGVNNIWADSGEVSVEIGEDPNILVNPTPFEALPIFEVVGTGSLTVGNTTVTITGDSTQDIFIDSDIMEAYEDDNGAIISRNDRINLSGTDFPKLGEETRVESNGLTSVKITPKWWTI